MKTLMECSPANHLRQTAARCLFAGLLALVSMPGQVHAQGFKLLTTFTNPAPVNSGNFGFPVAAAGNDRVLIGAYGNSSGGVAFAGSAYLFALPYPLLTIARGASTVSVKWVTAETGLILQQTDQLGLPTMWSDTINSVSINGLTNVIQQTMVTTDRFYRLHRP